MRWILGLIIFSFFFCAPIAGSAETVQKETQGFVYYLFLPSGYNSSRTWPLIITLHPSTGRGNMMVDFLSEQAEKKGYIVAGPNSANSNYWDFSEGTDIFRMIEEIKKNYSIDSSRIFLTGFSSGAIMTYYLGLTYPEKFRAIAPFGGYLKKLESRGDISLSRRENKHIPVFILHGANDNVVSIKEALYAEERLKEFGYKVRLWQIGGLNHEYSADASRLMVNWFEKNKE
jgi:predicted peptidase